MLRMCLHLFVVAKRREWNPAHTASGIGWEDKGKETAFGGDDHPICMYLTVCPN